MTSLVSAILQPLQSKVPANTQKIRNPAKEPPGSGPLSRLIRPSIGRSQGFFLKFGGFFARILGFLPPFVEHLARIVGRTPIYVLHIFVDFPCQFCLPAHFYLPKAIRSALNTRLSAPPQVRHIPRRLSHRYAVAAERPRHLPCSMGKSEPQNAQTLLIRAALRCQPSFCA